MTDVFEVLGGDHAVIRRMLDALESSPDNSTGAQDLVWALVNTPAFLFNR